METELSRGLELFKKALSRHQMDLAKERLSSERSHSYFQFGKGENLTDISLSDEFLEDLPKTPEYERGLELYLTSVSHRVLSPHPEYFYCESGRPVRFRMQWPIEEHALRFAQVLRFTILDLRAPEGTLAKCIAILDPMPGIVEGTPFEIVRRVVNRARHDIDRGAIKFHSQQNHPAAFQEVNVIPPFPDNNPASEHELEHFIAEKAYWLGFKVGEKPASVWIADGWDAEYLSVSTKDLRQAAQLLEARELIELDADVEYAKPSKALLTKGLNALVSDVSSSKSGSISDFRFVKNDQLRRIVARDYKELHSLNPEGSPKAALILAGGLFEALLLDALVSSGKWNLNDGVQRSLKDMIAPAEAMGIVISDRLPDALRRYRILLHPAAETREELNFSIADAKLARSAVDALIQEVQERQIGRTSLTAN